MEKLKTYFYGTLVKNTELLGLQVSTAEGEDVYINDFDQMCSTDTLPRTVLIGKKQGSNYGRLIETNELYIK
ncbi:MAG: hypothetical protein WC979_00235 [Candidatus Pacearchaeota archaeon]|jgi:hypothetical protein